MKRAASVAVDRPVGRTLTYSLPDALAASVEPGMRVLVPLGNSRCTGLVLGVGELTEDTRIRPIEAIIDTRPILDSGLVATLRFALSWYRAEPGDLVRAALPAGVGIGAVRELLRVPDVAWPKSEELVDLEAAFQPDRPVQAKSIDPAQLKHLLRTGAVTADLRIKKQAPEPVTEWLRALIHPTEVPARAKAQRALLEAIYAAGDWTPKTALLKHTGLPRLLRTLEQRGAIERELRAFQPPPPKQRSRAPALNREQAAVVEAVAAGRGFEQHLVFGITGSGKTEVYLAVIAQVLERGQSALVLVPEIGLTPQMVQRFSARFGGDIAVLHSGLSSRLRRSGWYRAQRGEARVVIGARSAVFAAMPNLGCIIVDEEHDPSYKQGEGVRYHGRDLAIVRAQKSDIPVLLGSATPSLETYARAINSPKEIQLHRLTERATGAQLPPVTLIDMRRQKRGQLLSELLEKSIEETLARGEQAMLLLNRRGWAPSITCLDCGDRQECGTCSVPMVLHKPGYLLCHLCGWRGAPPKACAACGSSALHDLGFGTQQLEAYCAERFPDSKVARLDSDTATSARRLERTLASFAGGEIDLLVGTQMLSKGHDIAAVTLVGVVNADHGLRIPDPRGPERTFSLLTQVAGRAGRAGRPGRVFFQVYDPDHPAIRAAVEHDAEGFLTAELQKREALGLPPTRRAVTITCSHPEQGRAMDLARRFAKLHHREVTLLGPAPAVIAKVRGRYRIQLLATAKQAQTLQEWLDGAVALRRSSQSTGVRVAIDVDPNELM